jgi:Peptidase family M28
MPAMRRLNGSHAAVIVAAVLAAAVVPVPAAGPNPAAAPAPRPGEVELAAQVSSPRLLATVHDLVALGPRMGGTPSGDRAAAYLQAAFARLGLRTEVVEDTPALAHWEESWSVELLPGGKLATAWPYGFSPAVGPATGELLVVEDLAAVAAMAAADPARGPAWGGKVIYTPGDVPAAYAQLAKMAHPPLAILTSHPNAPPRYVDSALIRNLPPRAGNPIAVFAVSYDEGRRVARAAHGVFGARGASVRVALRSTVRQGRSRTVIATLPGGDAENYFLICAHGDSDSGGPGADDNASGEATVLEMARVFTTLERGHRIPRPRVSLRFAVWGSEYASSGAYVARQGEKLRHCLGVINFDETGTGAEREAIYFESNEVPWNARLLRTLDEVGADYVGKPGFWPEYTTNPSQGGTDSYAFLPSRYKGELESSLQIPATTIYTAAWDKLATVKQTPGWRSRGTPDPDNLKLDYSRYYHSSGDTPENTTDRKPQCMPRAVKAASLALLRLAFY